MRRILHRKAYRTGKGVTLVLLGCLFVNKSPRLPAAESSPTVGASPANRAVGAGVVPFAPASSGIELLELRELPADEVLQRRGELLAAATALLESRAFDTSWQQRLAPELWSRLRDFPDEVRDWDLEAIQGRLLGVEDEQKLPQAVRLRGALGRYLVARAVATNTELREQFSECRDQLVKLARLPRLNAAQADQAREHLRWLHRHGQSLQPAQAFDRRFGQPNLLVDVSRESLGILTEEPVNESRPINQQSDGRTVRGTAQIVGTVRLYPCPGEGVCEAVFQGRMFSQLSGSQGPVSFGLQGASTLTAQKRVWLSRDQFRAADAWSFACTNLQTRYVCTRRDGPLSRLIRRVAANVIEKEKPEAAREVSQEAAKEFRAEFDREVNQELREGEQSLAKDLLHPLAYLNLTPRTLQFPSTHERLQVQLTLNAPYSLPALTDAPALGQPFDLAVRMEESAIENLAEQLLGGEEIDVADLDSQLAKLAQQASLPASQESGHRSATEASQTASRDSSNRAEGTESKRDAEQAGDAGDELAFKIVFRRRRPLQIQFTEQRVRVTLSGIRYTVGKAILDRMNLTLTYRLLPVEGGWQLLLEGEPVITPPPKGRSLRFFAQRGVLRNRLVKELRKQDAEKISLKPFTLPDPGDDLGELAVSHLSADGGWLTAVLRRPGRTP